MSYGYGGGGYPPQGGGYPPQGGGYGGAPVGGGGYPPPNHLVWAILSMIFCCQPTGIVSVIFAAQVNSKYQSGDYAGATDSSNKAKTWALVSTILGGVWVVIWVLYVFLVVLAAGTSSTSGY